MRKFADDTKLGNKASSPDDCEQMQRCIDNLLIWADTWNMSFNVKKCKVLHIGRRNPKHQYTMNGTILQESIVERDIGVNKQ